MGKWFLDKLGTSTQPKEPAVEVLLVKTTAIRREGGTGLR